MRSEYIVSGKKESNVVFIVRVLGGHSWGSLGSKKLIQSISWPQQTAIFTLKRPITFYISISKAEPQPQTIFMLIPLLLFLDYCGFGCNVFVLLFLHMAFRASLFSAFPLLKRLHSRLPFADSQVEDQGIHSQWYSHIVKQTWLPTCKQRTQMFELVESIDIQNTAAFLNNEWIQIGWKFKVDVQSLLFICTLICLEEGRPGGGGVQQ